MLFYLSLLERSSQYWIGLCSGQMVLIIEHDSDLVARQYTYGAMHNIWRFINLLAPDSATIFKGSGTTRAACGQSVDGQRDTLVTDPCPSLTFRHLNVKSIRMA